MRKKLLLVLLLISCIALALFAGGRAEGDSEDMAVEPEMDPVTLRMGVITSESDPVTMAARRFAELVEERTDGMYIVQVIPGGALGGEIEMHDMIASGTLDLGCFGSGVPSSYNPEFQILLMPFLWESREQMIAFSKSEIQESMNDKYTAQSGVEIIASNWDMGLRHTISKKEVASIDDFDGLKIRVPQLPAWVEMFELLGAIPAALPFTEVYSAMQQGVVDAAESPINLIYSSSFYEQAKYLVQTGHIMYYNMVYIGEGLFSELSPDVQEVFVEAALEAGEYKNELTRSQEEEVAQELRDAGVTFVDVDRGAISRTMQSLYDNWEDQYGSEIRNKVDDFKASF